MPTTGQGTPRGRPCGRPTVRRPRRPCSDRAHSRDSCSNCPATVTTVATARRLLAVAHLQRPCYSYRYTHLLSTYTTLGLQLPVVATTHYEDHPSSHTLFQTSSY